MLKQLRNIYPSTIPLSKKAEVPFEEYTWFITDANDVIGISNNELTTKDRQLLSTFLKIYNVLLPNPTVKEQLWEERIAHNKNETAPHPYRFVVFTLPPNQIKPLLFKEAINELFNKATPILWNDMSNGIIIEEISHTDEQINYEQIIDILMADLSVNIKFYIGNIQYDFQHIKHYYTSLITVGQFVFQISNKEVMTYIQSIPYLLLYHLDEQSKEKISDSILKSFTDDEEMLKTIENFLLSNLNVSETAKKMYLHRNSLQYRIDKFISDTGINVQKFDQAVAVYLALLIKKSY